MIFSGGKFLATCFLKINIISEFCQFQSQFVRDDYTVVWEKFIVENIHTKIIHCKKFSSLLASDEKFFMVKFFIIELF